MIYRYIAAGSTTRMTIGLACIPPEASLSFSVGLVCFGCVLAKSNAFLTTRLKNISLYSRTLNNLAETANSSGIIY